MSISPFADVILICLLRGVIPSAIYPYIKTVLPETLSCNILHVSLLYFHTGLMCPDSAALALGFRHRYNTADLGLDAEQIQKHMIYNNVVSV